mmetsp:Transcript_39262/g.108198  ORF Transcript_39262/g.108198 Transcript_39262/m.108198 type:complete len:310 (-) Transcript_39262:34-963(-)
MIGRKALATVGKRGRGAVTRKKRWQLELAGELGSDSGDEPKRSKKGVLRDGRSSSRSSLGSQRAARSGSRETDASRRRSTSRAKQRRRPSSRSCSPAGPSRRAKSDSEPRSPSQGHAEEHAEAPDLAVSDVTSFSDFVRHSEQLVKLVRSMTMPDLVVLCKNMAHAKYYDGDLMSEVWRALRSHIPRGQYGLAEITDVVISLKDLNAYDQGVFNAVAIVVLPKMPFVSREQRQLLADAYQDLRHQGDDDFIKALSKVPLPEGNSIDAASVKAIRMRQVVCMVHGKQRSIDMMVDEGGGHFTCAPNRRCK